jgi:hypothetical protein
MILQLSTNKDAKMIQRAVQLNNDSEFELDLNIHMTYKFFITTVNYHLLTRSEVGKVIFYIICNVVTNVKYDKQLRNEARENQNQLTRHRSE